MGGGEIVFCREDHANWLCNTKWSTENTHISNSIQTEQVIFRNTYVSRYVHTVTFNEKRRYEIGKRSRRVIWAALRGRRMGKCNYIRISKVKKRI